MSKAIARGNKKTLIDNCFEDIRSFDFLKKKMCRVLSSEIKSMCSNKVNSILRSTKCAVLKNFKWSQLIHELKVNAPLLYCILNACVGTSVNREAVICMCCSIILSSCFKRMCLVQKIISLILYAGHTGKEVNMYTYCIVGI